MHIKPATFIAAARELFTLTDAPVPGFCRVQECTDKRTRDFPFCFKHRSQIARYRDPVLHQYHRLKQAAKTRRIPFSLTMEEWRAWCRQTGYAHNRTGERADLPSVDRKDDTQGYHIGNIQVLTVSQNSIKELTKRYAKRVVRGRVILSGEYREEQPADPLDAL